MAKNLVSRVWRLGGVFFLICFAVHFSLGPASALRLRLRKGRCWSERSRTSRTHESCRPWKTCRGAFEPAKLAASGDDKFSVA